MVNLNKKTTKVCLQSTKKSILTLYRQLTILNQIKV